jgi:PKD repeat protein
VKKVGLVAGFQTKPTTLSGTAPFTVKFTDSSLGTITSRTWDFGDGTTDSKTLNPTHTYDAVGSGSYKVTLTIGDGTDSDYTTKTIYVTSPVTATTTSTSSVSSVGAITLEDLIIPGPFDIIKEFLNLFYSLLNSDNYLFLNNTTT